MLQCRNWREAPKGVVEFDMAGPPRQPPCRPIPKPDFGGYYSRDYVLRKSFSPGSV
jgi:hypothetical protein